MIHKNVHIFRSLRQESEPLALERRATLLVLQEALLLGGNDLRVVQATEVTELLDDDGLVVPPSRVRRHLRRLSVERPDLITEVEGRGEWIVRLAGLDEAPDSAS